MNPSILPFNSLWHEPGASGLQEISPGLDAGGPHRPMAASGLLPAVQVSAFMESARRPAVRSATKAASHAPLCAPFLESCSAFGRGKPPTCRAVRILRNLLPMVHL